MARLLGTLWAYCLRLRFWVSGVEGSGFRVERVQGLKGLGFRGLGFRGLGFKGSGV